MQGEKAEMILQVGPYPKPIGGISIYVKRMKELMDLLGISNEVWDLSEVKKEEKGVAQTRLRYVPLKLIFRRDIKLIHYNIPGINHKLYIGVFNKLFFKKRKKLLTIHGDSKNLFKTPLIVKALNSFDGIICVKSGDKEYLREKGIRIPVYEVPAFLFPEDEDESTTIPKYILDFIESKSFVICANASSIQFYEGKDLYGIDMCINLIERLKKNREKIGMVFSMPQINNAQYFNELKNMITSKKIDNNFLFVNEKMELYPIIKRSHLFIRPTNTDGDAVSIREALYYKIPVIASDVVIRPKETIVFKNRDMDDLYNKTAEVIDNYKQFKERLENIHFEDNGKKLLEIYEELLSS